MKDTVHLNGATDAIQLPDTRIVTGVSRLLPYADRAFEQVLFQQGRPILDSELNLVQTIMHEAMDSLSRTIMQAGILSNLVPLSDTALFAKFQALDFLLDGRAITISDSQTTNDFRVQLPPLPLSGSRTDLVWLIVYREEVASDQSANARNVIKRHGNLAGETVPNDLRDPALPSSYETTRRIQRSYRVVSSSGLSALNGAPALSADGIITTSYYFAEMVDQAGIYIAGNGTTISAETLGTVDGYAYAIPLATVLRSAGDTTNSSANITAIAPKAKLKPFYWTSDTISHQPAGALVSTNVEDALNELDAKKMSFATYDPTGSGIVSNAENAESVSWTGVTDKPSTLMYKTTYDTGGDGVVDFAALAGTANNANAVPWTGITGKPINFMYSSVYDPAGDGVVDFAAFSNTANVANSVTWANVSGKPATFPANTLQRIDFNCQVRRLRGATHHSRSQADVDFTGWGGKNVLITLTPWLMNCYADSGGSGFEPAARVVVILSAAAGSSLGSHDASNDGIGKNFSDYSGVAAPNAVFLVNNYVVSSSEEVNANASLAVFGGVITATIPAEITGMQRIWIAVLADNSELTNNPSNFKSEFLMQAQTQNPPLPQTAIRGTFVLI
jgi:hypothetical protein